MLRLSPGGRLPLETVNVWGPVPPLALMEVLCAVPTTPAARVLGLTVMTGQICTVIACVPWQPAASVTLTVTLEPGDDTAVGVPEITPVELFSVRPEGRLPLMIVQEP